jgi:hypothetical protein
MLKKYIALALVLLMAVGTLTGCGGSDKSASETIKVGILGPHTGDYAQYGLAVRNGAQLYIDQVNAAGGINGKQMKPLSMTRRATPPKRSQRLQKWWTKASPPSSATCSPATPSPWSARLIPSTCR